MTTIVTGATGHLGRHIIESLLRAGVAPSDIVAGGRRPERLSDLQAAGVGVARVDYADPSSLAAAFTGADTVVLVSASEPGKRVDLHSAVVDAARDAGVTRLIYTSAPAATTSALILAPDHKATEEYIVASGIPYTFLRNGWYTENYEQAARQAAETGTLVASVGDGRVASASRSDFADAAAAVVVGSGHENQVYELSGDVAWHFDDLAAAISEITGRAVVYRPISAEEHFTALTDAGLDAGIANFVVALDQNTEQGLLGGTSGELRRLIGRPTTPLVDGLRPVLA